MAKQKVYLMRTNFIEGYSEIVDKFENIPIKLAKVKAFIQKDKMNATQKAFFYWVKCINF